MEESAVGAKISNIEKSVVKIELELQRMTDAITKIAVQKERLDTLAMRVDAIWIKLDNTILPSIAKCPKEQVRWLWYIVLPMGFTQMMMGLALLKLFTTSP